MTGMPNFFRLKSFLVLIAMLCLSSVTASQADEALTASEIDRLLRGNTIEGSWSGAAYTQYFSDDGQTIYLQANRRPEIGRWRVNSQTDQYESWWEQTGWTGYTILRTDTGYGWKRDAKTEPFTVLPGKKITW